MQAEAHEFERQRPVPMRSRGIFRAAFMGFAAIAGLAMPSPAAASCAAPPALADAVESASSVFIGEVTAAAFDSEEATLSVLWIWKGPDLSAELTVSTPLADGGGEAGFRFREGSTYIVVVQQIGSPTVIGECSGTTAYRDTGEEVPPELRDAVGSDTGRLPSELVQEEPSDPNAQARTRAVLIGILAAVGMILVVIMQYQSHRDDDDPGRKKRLRGLFSLGRSGDRQADKLRRKD